MPKQTTKATKRKSKARENDEAMKKKKRRPTRAHPFFPDNRARTKKNKILMNDAWEELNKAIYSSDLDKCVNCLMELFPNPMPRKIWRNKMDFNIMTCFTLDCTQELMDTHMAYRALVEKDAPTITFDEAVEEVALWVRCPHPSRSSFDNYLSWGDPSSIKVLFNAVKGTLFGQQPVDLDPMMPRDSKTTPQVGCNLALNVQDSMHMFWTELRAFVYSRGDDRLTEFGKAFCEQSSESGGSQALMFLAFRLVSSLSFSSRVRAEEKRVSKKIFSPFNIDNKDEVVAYIRQVFPRFSAKNPDELIATVWIVVRCFYLLEKQKNRSFLAVRNPVCTLLPFAERCTVENIPWLIFVLITRLDIKVYDNTKLVPPQNKIDEKTLFTVLDRVGVHGGLEACGEVDPNEEAASWWHSKKFARSCKPSPIQTCAKERLAGLFEQSTKYEDMMRLLGANISRLLSKSDSTRFGENVNPYAKLYQALDEVTERKQKDKAKKESKVSRSRAPQKSQTVGAEENARDSADESTDDNCDDQEGINDEDFEDENEDSENENSS